MSTNKYKAAMMDEKFDEKKLDELCKLLEDYDDTEPSPKPTSRKFRLPVLLAAALIISALGCTTVAAAAGTGLIDIGGYFALIRQSWLFADRIPAATDTSQFENNSQIEALSNTGSGLIDPKVTNIISDGHRAWIEITVDASKLELPDNLPQEAMFGFRSDKTELHTFDNELQPVSRQDSGVYKYIYDLRDIGVGSHWFRGKADIILTDFGYFVSDKFTALVKDEFTISLTEDMFYTIGNNKKISDPMDVKGVMLDLELSPIGLTVRGSYSEMKRLNLYYDKYYLCQPNILEFYMRDGSVMKYYEETGDGDFDVGALYDLMIGTDGGVEDDTDTALFEFLFSSPLDIDEVTAISVHGVRFELYYPDDEAGSRTAVNAKVPDIYNYFVDYTRKHWKHQDIIQVNRNKEQYANETEISATCDSAQSKISPRITTIVSDGYKAWIQITVDAKGLTIPDDLPANTLFGFEKEDVFKNYYLDLPPRITKQDNGVYVLTYNIMSISNTKSGLFIGEEELTFENFGYNINDSFTPLAEGKFSFKVTDDMFNTVANCRKVAGAKEVKGVMLDIELDPIGLTISGSKSRMEELGLLGDKYYLIQSNIYDLYMRDGSVLKYAEGPSESGFIAGALYDLNANSVGGYYNEETDAIAYRYNFTVPIDIDEVEAVSVHGVRFELHKPGEESQNVVPDIYDYFESYNSADPKYQDKIQVNDNKEQYAHETEISADCNIIDPKITAIVSDRHSAWIQITVDANGLNMPAFFPGDTLFGFEEDGVFQIKNGLPKVKWQQSKVFVFTYDIRDIGNGVDGLFVGETELVLKNFGFYIGEEFHLIAGGKYSFRLTEDMLDTVEDTKKFGAPMDVKGVMLDLELSPIGLSVRGSYSKMVELGLYDSFQPDIFEFYMRDGSILRYSEGPSESGFKAGALYGLIIGMDGTVNEETDTSIHRFPFSSPISIDEVEAIAVHGVRFELLSKPVVA